MGLSSPGIGSNLDITGIVTKLMQVEAQPLTTLDKKEASYQARLTAFGSLSGAFSSFQNALATLATPARFQAQTASLSDASIGSVSTTDSAVAGSYALNVTQLARAQTLSSAGQQSSSAAIGSGGSSTVTFQFGTIGFAASGNKLDASVAASGIPANALSINGSTIVTSASSNSAKALAAQINLQKVSTGVTATAQPSDSGVLAFSAVTTGTGDSFGLSVAGVSIASVGADSSLSAAQLDAALASTPIANALKAKNISVSGSAVSGTLRFISADGSNIDITQTLTDSSNSASGGLAGLSSGVTAVFSAGISLASSAAITVAGNNPAAAGLSAGTSGLSNGVYTNGTFALDPGQASGSVVIDSSNNSLQGIRDAINKAKLGVTASIVSDGSDTPYHLVLTSNKTGLKSSMKISTDGNEPALTALLTCDPSSNGGQNMTQTSEALNTVLTVNGITVNSANNTVAEAMQGTTLTISKLGASNLSITRDTASVTAAVNSFVSAYNSLQKTISSLTSYDASTKKAGLLNGDGATRQIQAQVRAALATPLRGVGGALDNLTQLGVSYTKDGSMTLDAAKLQNAISNNFADISSLFATVATASDSLVRFNASGANTKPGAYQINVSRVATRGVSTGSVDLNAASTVIGAGATLSVTLDGTSANVPLSPGSWSASQLAAMLQSAINGNPTFSGAGSSVAVSVDDNGHLKLSSARYGSASTVSLGNAAADNTATALMGSGASSTAGQDVAGTIGGISATGSGRLLKGAAGSATDGLSLEITGGSAGARGTVNFSNGYAATLNTMISGFVGSSGAIASSTSGLNSNIKQISEQRASFNARLATKQKMYLAQFTALDQIIGKMNQTSNYLTQQLAQISANSGQN